MTAMERFLAACRAESLDRVPVFCFMSDQGAKELGMTPQDYYSRGENVAEAQLRMLDRYGYDNVWSLFYVGREAELLGCRRILFATNGPPNVGDMVIKCRGDIERLQVPADVSTHPLFAEQRACLGILRRAVGGKVPICAYSTSSMSLPAMLMGMERWMELLFLGEPEARDALLSKCHEFFVKEVKAYRDAGVDVILYANPFGSTEIVPAKFFMEQSLPWIEKDIAAVGTDGIVYYCGTARVNNVIQSVLERTGIGAYTPSPLEDVAEAAHIIAGRALTCGMINDLKLIDWSRVQIRNDVRRIMAAGIDCGKFLFSTAVMPYAIPEENIRTMLEAAFEFGAHRKREGP